MKEARTLSGVAHPTSPSDEALPLRTYPRTKEGRIPDMISSEEDLIEVLDANGNLFFFNPHPEKLKRIPRLVRFKQLLEGIFNNRKRI